MNIQILSECETVNDRRDLINIEQDIKQLISRKTRNKQLVFNSLFEELKPFYTGFKIAYFMGLLKEVKDKQRENLKGIVDIIPQITNNDRFRVYRFLKESDRIEQQYKGLEVVFKDTTTEFNKIPSKVMRWAK